MLPSISAIARSDVLYHPGRVSKFANDPPFTCNDEPFRHNSPDHVKQLISSSVSEHAAGSPACRQAIVPHSVEADLHFPLFCTPYYGFVPSTEVDLLVEILQLSSFLCTCCFSSEGEGLSQLGDSLPTASALLSMLSAIPNERSGGSIAVFPGTGMFICDPAPAPQQGEPAVACWLYTPARLPPPPPKAFAHLSPLCHQVTRLFALPSLKPTLLLLGCGRVSHWVVMSAYILMPAFCPPHFSIAPKA